MLRIESEVIPTRQEYTSVNIDGRDLLKVGREVLSEEHWQDSGTCTEHQDVKLLVCVGVLDGGA